MQQDGSRKGAGRRKGEQGTRAEEVIAAAALLFAERGYAGTSIRDIGEKVGLLGGSLYHYIGSKEALFVRVHDLALETAEQNMRAAMDGIDDPVERLAEACAALLSMQLDPQSLTMPLMNDFRSTPPAIRDQLIERRDAFEAMFGELLAPVPVPDGVDRAIYRILILKSLNSVSDWYRPGRLSPREIALQILNSFAIRV